MRYQHLGQSFSDVTTGLHIASHTSLNAFCQKVLVEARTQIVGEIETKQDE